MTSNATADAPNPVSASASSPPTITDSLEPIIWCRAPEVGRDGHVFGVGKPSIRQPPCAVPGREGSWYGRYVKRRSGLAGALQRVMGRGRPAVDSVPSSMERSTLRSECAQDELEHFGFTIVPFLDDQQLQAVREAYAELGPAPDDPGVALNWSFHSRSSVYKRAVGEVFLPLVQDAVDGLFEEYESFLTTFIIKWPGSNGGFAPHQDPSLVDEREFRGVTLWIPLDDTGPVHGADNGMLNLVPGSHKFSRQLRESNVDRWVFADHEEAIVSRYGVGVPTTAGEALVFDNRVIHYSMPNQTDSPRVVLSLGMRPREASCVLVRTTPAGMTEVFDIDDDFYVDVLPAEQHLWNPPGEPLAQVHQDSESWTSEDFGQLCEAVPDAPRGIRASGSDQLWQDPGLFCALCGSTSGLEETDRAERNNAQLVCSSCRDGLGVPTA